MKKFFQKLIAFFLVYPDEKRQNVPKRVPTSFTKYLLKSWLGSVGLALVFGGLITSACFLRQYMLVIMGLGELIIGMYLLSCCYEKWRAAYRGQLSHQRSYRNEPASEVRNAPAPSFVRIGLILSSLMIIGSISSVALDNQVRDRALPGAKENLRSLVYEAGEVCHPADEGVTIECPVKGEAPPCLTVTQFCDPNHGNRATACTVRNVCGEDLPVNGMSSSDGCRLGERRNCSTEDFRLGHSWCNAQGQWLDCVPRPQIGDECVVGRGACTSTGVIVLTEGLVECDAVPGDRTVEVCNNGIDEDCDGSTDEGCTR